MTSHDTSQNTSFPVARESGSFADDRSANIREAPAHHPYAHHIRVLPRSLQELVPDLRVPPGGDVLDYGCSDAPYRGFFGSDVNFVGADLPGNPVASVDISSDGSLPIEAASFDAVLSTQVLEHVDNPALYLRECFRVLRPGGRLLLSTHGSFVYHPDPVDYWRWTCAGLERQILEAGFEILRHEGIIGLAATGLQFVEDAVQYRLRSDRFRKLVGLVFHGLMRFADRIESRDSKRLNACVFAVIAAKP